MNRRDILAAIAASAFLPRISAAGISQQTSRRSASKDEPDVRVLLVTSSTSVGAADPAVTKAFRAAMARVPDPGRVALSHAYLTRYPMPEVFGAVDLARSPGFLARERVATILVECEDELGLDLRAKLVARGESFVHIRRVCLPPVEWPLEVHAIPTSFGYEVVVPDHWGWQFEHQLSRGKGADGHCTLEDFERGGYPMSELCNRLDNHLAGAIASVVVRVWQRKGLAGITGEALALVESQRSPDGALLSTKTSFAGGVA
jgi:hypothetical protein